eukprot:TRINITY_DN2890_c0_g1_i1.p1 TRINITY_DN2890_c0_g1~~TRINITY_DN2890_c0_g1_i1.p1  ORF type:complete len:319 (+),score=69.50 TRINITY_DN2890_c0_g1_i1:98-958(+)
MMNAGPSGFDHAPVTKGLVLATGFSSLFVSLTKTHHLVALKMVPNILPGLQLWRLITSHFTFTTPAEILFGMLLLYNFRCFERQMGSRRFGAFTLSTLLISTLIQIAFLAIQPSLSFLSPGQYGMIFAMFVLFNRDIPKTHRFRVFGVTLTDKVFTYLLGLQLLLSNSPQSLFAALSGIIAGVLYRSDSIGLRNRFSDLPDPIVNFFRRFCLPLIQSSPSQQQQRNMVNPFSGQGHVMGNNNGGQAGGANGGAAMMMGNVGPRREGQGVRTEQNGHLEEGTDVLIH